jgi:peptidoglycan hydrolase-like protein with peptidoglycan-binding domain
MKKIVLGIVLSFLLMLPASAAEFNTNLKYGLRNNKDVIKLQEFLTSEDLYAGPITGNFYSLTLKAVKAFQKRETISATGFVGVLTRARINTLIESDLAESAAEEQESGWLDVPADSKTTDDVVSKLQEQISATQQQNQLLQQQLTQQQALQSSISQVVQNTTPAAPTIEVTLADTTAPKVTYNNRCQTYLQSSIGWPNPNFQGYGAASLSCSNCMRIATDEPTTLKLEYFNYTDLGNSLSDENGENELLLHPEKILTFTDNTLSAEHILSYSTLGLKEDDEYYYHYTVTDASGNITHQDSSISSWHGSLINSIRTEDTRYDKYR